LPPYRCWAWKTAEEAARSYASPLVALVLGGALLAAAAVKVGLHRQVAAQAVRASGGDARRLVLTLMIATAVIGTLVAPGVLTIFMTEIALAVIAGSKVDTAQEQGRRFAVATIVGVAYAAAIGSLTTITANPVNAVAAGL
jgi:solute carrier family 13 (sodium-dependent dicarboxylate transporter), member 2/3/5